MRLNIHLIAGLALVLMLIMTGCSSQGPVGPEADSGNSSWAAARTLPADQGAWQTVELVWCGGDGQVSGETPTGLLRYHVSQDLIFEGTVQRGVCCPTMSICWPSSVSRTCPASRRNTTGPGWSFTMMTRPIRTPACPPCPAEPEEGKSTVISRW